MVSKVAVKEISDSLLEEASEDADKCSDGMKREDKFQGSFHGS